MEHVIPGPGSVTLPDFSKRAIGDAGLDAPCVTAAVEQPQCIDVSRRDMVGGRRRFRGERRQHFVTGVSTATWRSVQENVLAPRGLDR